MTRSGYLLPRIVLLMSIAFTIVALTAYSVVFGDEPLTKTGSGTLTLELKLDSPAPAAENQKPAEEKKENAAADKAKATGGPVEVTEASKKIEEAGVQYNEARLKYEEARSQYTEAASSYMQAKAKSDEAISRMNAAKMKMDKAYTEMSVAIKKWADAQGLKMQSGNDSPAPTAKEEPVSFESLENQFEKEFLAAIAKVGDKALTGESMYIGFKLSKEIFGKHPEVLKAEAKRLLAAIPRIEESAWSQCRKEEIPNELLQIMPPAMGDGSANPLYHRGWDPAFVATMVKQSILVKKIGIEDLGRSAQIAHFIPPKVFVVKDATPTTIAIRQADGYFLVGLELTEEGVFRPVSATWMHKKAEK